MEAKVYICFSSEELILKEWWKMGYTTVDKIQEIIFNHKYEDICFREQKDSKL